MAIEHSHILVDADPHFSIDATTRSITNLTSKKVSMTQYDHNSECFSFDVDRYIEGHDVFGCDKIQIHYCVTNPDTQEKHVGLYEVRDLHVHPTNPNKASFTWLISQNTTRKTGILGFAVSFYCIEDGEVIYRWGSGVYNAINIYSGMNNHDIIADLYTDILDDWEIRLTSLISENNKILTRHISACEEMIRVNVSEFKVEMRDYVNSVNVDPTEFATTLEVEAIFGGEHGEDNTGDWIAGYIQGYNDCTVSTVALLRTI